MNVNEELAKSVTELAGELGAMHATLYKLIIDLRTTSLGAVQRDLINEAMAELRLSQKRFLAKYADTLGGTAPERN
jgi:hypothetical protein